MDVNVPSKINEQKLFPVGVLVIDEKFRIQNRIRESKVRIWGSDPCQNVTDPERWN